MFCPMCGEEYRPGFTECADCRVPLVTQPPEKPPALGHPRVELVTIFRSGNPAIIAVAKSLLESAEIRFLTKGEDVQDLIGWGRFPAGLNVLAGPVEFQVDSEDAEEATSFLKDLQESNETPGDDSDDDD